MSARTVFISLSTDRERLIIRKRGKEMIYLIIYFMGYFLAFVYLIYIDYKYEDVTTDTILSSFVLSLFSWFIIVIILLATMKNKVIFKKRNEK